MENNMNMPKNKIYIIKLQGYLSESWADWFDEMDFTHECDGTTTLTGKVVDQSALHGLLKKISDLGLPLISVNQIDYGEKEASE